MRFNWNAGIAIDPFDGSTVYYGSQFVHKSTDRGNAWEIISPDLTTNNPEWQKQRESGGLTFDVTGAENFTSIMTIAPSAVQQGVIWVGTDDGRVHVTQDGGATWTSLEERARGVPANTWVPHIEPSKYDGGSAYVVFDNHRRGDFTPYAFEVTEYGRRWRSIVTDDIWGYALAIEQDPVEEDLLFLGTEFGLYVSLNRGQSWIKWEHGFPTASVMALVVHPREHEHDLVIGTHGRSVFIIDDIRPLRTISAETMAEPIHLFEIPEAIQYRGSQSAGEGSPGHGEFRGENRAFGAMITFSLNVEGLPHPSEAQPRPEGFGQGPPSAQRRPGAPGQGRRGPQLSIEISDADGEVIRTFRGRATMGVNRVAWNLRRDGFRRPSAGGQQQRQFGGFQPSGPEVLPGTYGVKVKYGEHEATGSVNVLADPRYDIPLSERREKQAAIMYAGALGEVIADAVERIRDTRGQVEAVIERLERGDELARAGRTLNETLTELEKKFWSPPGSGGQRVPRTDNVSRLVGRAAGSMGSSWDAPTQAQEIRLQQAEALLQDALAEMNRVFAEDVANFRSQVQSADIAFLEAQEPLTMPRR